MTHPVSKYEPLIIAYLTGQASPEEVTTYKALYDTSPEFCEHVSKIERWLSPLNAETIDKIPPENLLSDIMAQIDGDEADDDTSPSRPNVSPVRREDPQQKPANDNTLSRWKFATLTASIIAALALGSHLLPNSKSQTVDPVQSVQAPTTSTPTTNTPTTSTRETQSLIALLSDDTKPSLVAIVYDPTTLKIVARLSNVVLPDDGDLELWLIREGANAPISLGLLNKAETSDTIEFVLPQSLQTASDTLAISLEPLGGSGTQKGPQGPILFTGGVTEL